MPVVCALTSTEARSWPAFHRKSLNGVGSGLSAFSSFSSFLSSAFFAFSAALVSAT
jgi:hypothetical protein